MFSSSYFTDEMLIQYYYKYLSVPGTHEFLTNKLYGMRREQVEGFAPYLCYMLVKCESKPLERFLVDLSGTNFTVFLLVFWCMHAFSYTDRQVKEKKMRIDIIERVLLLLITYSRAWRWPWLIR
jgi:hypothetical protein